MNQHTDLFVRISRGYMIAVPLLLLGMFFITFLISNDYDRPQFEALEARWGHVLPEPSPCREYGYVNAAYLQNPTTQGQHQKQMHQDQVALMQYTLAPIIVWESTSERCLLVDVKATDASRVGLFARTYGYRVAHDLGRGRYVLLQDN